LSKYTIEAAKYPLQRRQMLIPCHKMIKIMHSSKTDFWLLIQLIVIKFSSHDKRFWTVLGKADHFINARVNTNMYSLIFTKHNYIVQWNIEIYSSKWWRHWYKFWL